MERGFDSYRPDAALQQAEQRGERTFLDRIVGVPGTVGEFVRLALGCGLIGWLIGANATPAVPYMQTPTGLLLAIVITMTAGPIGLMAADRLAGAFASMLVRRIAWGLVCAATFLLTVRVLLAVALLAILRIQGVGAEQAGQDSFVGAAWFTLMIALPGWGLCFAWALLRPVPSHSDKRTVLFRILATVLVVGAILLLGSEGAHFDSLKR